MEEIEVIREGISRNRLREIAQQRYGDLVKAVVDTQHEIMAVGGEMHADAEQLLMNEEHASREHTWGINIYPDVEGEHMIEFDSLVNLKPQYGNKTRGVDDVNVQDKIMNIIRKLIT